MPDTQRQRHSVVWLRPGCASLAKPTHVACQLDSEQSGPDAIAVLAEWILARRPLVVSRQEGTQPGMIRLGLPLPPDRGKRRLGFDVPMTNVMLSAAPPPLHALGEGLPESFQSTLAALCTRQEIRACAPRAFGSVAMQWLTGLPYLTDASDLDLALSPPDWATARAAIDTLLGIEADRAQPQVRQRPGIDGEIIDPLGRAICWRELAGAADTLLSKHVDGVALIARSDFIDAFGRADRGRKVA